MAFRCTKLVQWLAIVALFLETWYALVTGWLPINMSREMYTAVLPVSSRDRTRLQKYI